jgi:hypothetical protein
MRRTGSDTSGQNEALYHERAETGCKKGRNIIRGDQTPRSFEQSITQSPEE